MVIFLRPTGGLLCWAESRRRITTGKGGACGPRASRDRNELLGRTDVAVSGVGPFWTPASERLFHECRDALMIAPAQFQFCAVV
jgi:hypothetical protein